MHPRTTIFAVLLLAVVAHADNLTGTVRDGSGLPIAGAFVEVRDVGTFTTGATGVFSVTLPRGTYDLQIYEIVNGLSPTILAAVVVNGTKNVGIVTLNAGFLVSGTVMGPAGAVVNGDLDVFDVETGIKLRSDNDKTDALGQFSIAVPAREVRLRAEPAAGQVLVAQSMTALVTANIQFGIITLPSGHLLSGTVVAANTNLPLAGVDLDVDDFNSGLRIETPGDNTDASGNFSVIVPSGSFRVGFGAAGGQAYVGKVLDYVTVNASTALGTITLAPGVVVNGTVKDTSGHPVARCDLDVRSLAGDQNIFVPNDETGPAGLFSVVVPAGMHRFLFHPESSTGLVATSTGYLNVVATTTLPLTILQTGFRLSGLATAFGGIPQGDIKILVRNSATGALVETSNDVTDSLGSYEVVVPTGTYDLDCKTRKASILRDQVVSGISVSGPTTANLTFGLVPMLVYLDDPAFPGPQVVPPGSPQFFITIAIWNPTGVTSGVFMDVEWEDPYGNITTMLANSPVVLGSQQYIFQQFLAIPLPAVSPANIGLPHKFRIVLKDPANSETVDVDEFEIYPL